MKKKRLFRAADTGDSDEINRLIRKGVKVNTKSLLDGLTPLHIAARHGGVETARILMENGADVNAVEKASETPLHWAAERGHEKTVSLLLEKGASPEAKGGAYGETPLHSAAWGGHSKTARVLLDYGAGVNMKTWNDETPLHWACAGKGDKRTIKLLIENGASYDQATVERGETPLHTAARFDRFEAAEILTENGADTSLRDKDGCTPLEAAEKSGSKRTAAVLKRRSTPR